MLALYCLVDKLPMQIQALIAWLIVAMSVLPATCLDVTRHLEIIQCTSVHVH